MATQLPEFDPAGVAAVLIGTSDADTLLDVFKSLGKILTKPGNGLKLNQSLASLTFLVASVNNDTKVRVAAYGVLGQLVKHEPSLADDTIIFGVARTAARATNAEVQEAAEKTFKVIKDVLLETSLPQRYTVLHAEDMLRAMAPGAPTTETNIKNTTRALHKLTA